MRKSWWKCLPFVLVAAIIVLCWYSLPPKSPSRKINAKTYERIQLGMGLEEIEDLIGLPPGDYRDDAEKASGISPWGSLGISDATFFASEDWRKSVSWIGKDYAITLFLNDAGSIVEDKQLCTPLTPKRRSLVEQLRHWLDR
jgi:hypothetical protein